MREKYTVIQGYCNCGRVKLENSQLGEYMPLNERPIEGSKKDSLIESLKKFDSLTKVKKIVQNTGVVPRNRRCADVANQFLVNAENNPEVQESYVCNVEAYKMSTHHAFNVLRVDDRYYSVDINNGKILEGDNLKQLREDIVSTYTFNNDPELLEMGYKKSKHVLLSDRPIAEANISEDDEIVNYKWHEDGTHKCKKQSPCHKLFPTDFASVVPQQNASSLFSAASYLNNGKNLEQFMPTALAVPQLFPVAFANSAQQSTTATLREGGSNLAKLIKQPFASKVKKDTITPDSISSSRIDSDDSFFMMI